MLWAMSAHDKAAAKVAALCDCSSSSSISYSGLRQHMTQQQQQQELPLGELPESSSVREGTLHPSMQPRQPPRTSSEKSGTVSADNCAALPRRGSYVLASSQSTSAVMQCWLLCNTHCYLVLTYLDADMFEAQCSNCNHDTHLFGCSAPIYTAHCWW
jgi:hypothetical protein